MYYAEEIIDNVRSSNDIVDVISSYVRIQKKGASYMGLCPFHGEKTPSFSVSPSRQMYHCFGCGAGGNVISFIMQYENFTFLEAVKLLADRAGITLPEVEISKEERAKKDLKAILLEIHKEAAMYFYYQLYSDKGERARRYLSERGLLKEDITHFGLGYSNKTSDDLYRYLKSKGYDDGILSKSGLVTIEERGGRDKFWNRIMFPILDINAKVIGFGGRVMGEGMPKYLNSPETLLFDKSKQLYGMNFARTSRKDYMLICEGYMDTIALHKSGFTNAVASLGTAFTPYHARLIKRYAKKVILTYDSDGAGIAAAKRAIPILKAEDMSIKILDMKPYKDPDEFIQNLGKEAFEKRIEEARNSFLWEIDILKTEYAMEDPEQRTDFYKEVAKKLAEFSEAMERENYLQTVCREHNIPYEEMKKEVNRIGNQNYTSEYKKANVYARAKENGILKTQKLFLTWLLEDTSLFEKTKVYLSYADFSEGIYREIAQRIYEDYEKGILSPAKIVDDYIGNEEKTKLVAEILNTEMDITEDERKKAIEESILKIKTASIEERSKRTVDIKELQELIHEQNRLKTEKINIRW